MGRVVNSNETDGWSQQSLTPVADMNTPKPHIIKKGFEIICIKICRIFMCTVRSEKV